jgi:hypothetical protein
MGACSGGAKKGNMLTVFLNTTEDVVYIIREEALRVQHRLD